MSIVPAALRDRFSIGPGPESGDSRFSESRPHSPEKSGTRGSAEWPGPASNAQAAATVAANLIFLPKRLSIKDPAVCPPARRCLILFDQWWVHHIVGQIGSRWIGNKLPLIPSLL